MDISDDEILRILDDVLEQSRTIRASVFRDVLTGHGLNLVSDHELEDLRRQSRQYGEALHTPRSQGGLSAT